MIKTVLVTGGTGFVGRQICSALAAEGIAIRLVVREGTNGAKPEVQGVDRTITTPDLFAESVSWWANACQSVDAIIHAAWYTEPGKYLRSSKNLDCLIGTLQMAKGCVQAGVKRFAGIGTCFEYDLTEGLLAVDTPLKPETPYAASKVATFTALSQWLPERGLSFSWYRLFYLYGEGEDKRRFVPYLRAMLASGQPAELTKGEQVRDYLDVREAGRMIVEAVLNDSQGAINICSGIPITVREFAETIAEEYGRKDLLRFGARPENLVDPPRVIGVRSR